MPFKRGTIDQEIRLKYGSNLRMQGEDRLLNLVFSLIKMVMGSRSSKEAFRTESEAGLKLVLYDKIMSMVPDSILLNKNISFLLTVL
jgi:hypothetical protein